MKVTYEGPDRSEFIRKPVVVGLAPLSVFHARQVWEASLSVDLVIDALEEVASAWLSGCVDKDDIEQERQHLEAKYHRKIAVNDVERLTRSGGIITRVTWRLDD